MNKELYVSSTPHETKVALMEDDQLAEVFFERENEYTLAGSIYKGRVTRVLPGMQSAFVDIGLERDAFLYVSDFLELSSEDEDEEFGNIPAPRTTVELRQPVVQEMPSAEGEFSASELETEEASETLIEEFPAPGEELSAVEPEAAPGEERDSGEGARRWRGRRRRGGRRGRDDDFQDRPEPKTEFAKPSPAEAAPVSERPRTDFAPPPRYNPMVLPGESISKYRNLAQQPAAEVAPQEELPKPQETTAEQQQVQADEAREVQDAHDRSFNPEATHAIAPEERFSDLHQEAAHHEPALPAEITAALAHGETEHTEAPRHYEEQERPRNLDVAPLEYSKHQPEVHAPETPVATVAETFATTPRHQEEIPVETAGHFQPHGADIPSGGEQIEAESYGTATATQPPPYQQLAAPSVAPEGRTLEHEVLEDEEMEFHPVPDDISALSEVAGDEELVLEEETLDSDNGYSDRWIPTIADVDEDEVVAAEMRGENLFAAEADEEEEDEEAGEQEETNGRAELRAASPTAGYQQRQQGRPGYDRQYRDRNRRGGPRRNLRSRPNTNRNQPLITDLLKEGQEILVQIAKEPIGKKGARITSHIALPGRFLVYMPTVNHVGVSRKIASEEERQRLKRIVTSERENGIGGFIVRTAAANIKEEDLRADIRFLKHLWAEIKSRADSGKSPALIYHDLNLVERVLRDQVNADFSQIWVDTEDEYERVVRFANRFQPSLVRRIKLYTKDTPLYEEFGIQDEINQLAEVEGVAQERWLHRHQPDRSVGCDRRQHRQIRWQDAATGGHHRQDQRGCHQGDCAPDSAA